MTFWVTCIYFWRMKYFWGSWCLELNHFNQVKLVQSSDTHTHCRKLIYWCSLLKQELNLKSIKQMPQNILYFFNWSNLFPITKLTTTVLEMQSVNSNWSNASNTKLEIIQPKSPNIRLFVFSSKKNLKPKKTAAISKRNSNIEWRGKVIRLIWKTNFFVQFVFLYLKSRISFQLISFRNWTQTKKGNI